MGKRQGVHLGMRDFLRWIIHLLRQPVFIFVTLWGNTAILVGGLLFYKFESGLNPEIQSLFDAYYWAIATATTVGAGNIVPHTLAGKLVSVAMMMTGALFLWSYAALFASSVMMPTVRAVGRDVRDIEEDVREEQLLVKRLLKLLDERDRQNGGR